MTAKIWIVTLGALLFSALCKAQDVCPWINTATVIDGPDPAVSDVQSIVTDGGKTCMFHYRKSGLLYNMQIAVHPLVGNAKDEAANAAKCKAAKTSLAGIGNEAALCSTGAHGERVVGRVRDRVFVVDVSVKTGHGSNETAKALGDMATLMAEQVAGNLF